MPVKKSKPSKKASNKPSSPEDGDIFDAKVIIDVPDLKGAKSAVFKAQDDEDSDQIGSTPIVSEVVIEPIGYPIRMAGSDQSPSIIVDNEDLFHRYAMEQWNSMKVDVGTYLFDSYLFPDFAFQVVAVRPDAGKISNETKILFKNKTQDISTKIETVHMREVIGQEAAKKKCRVILKYLEEPELFGREWAPRNILFHGVPGTGKTMLARALASEAKANFMSRNATTLIGVHVGDGAKKIHDLYELAKQMAPVIIFIDELDAIGLSRSFQHVRGDVIEIATALLSELDGIDVNEGIVTIGATNQAELLDPALRSRFEEEIEFKIPTLEDRIQLIKLYSAKTPLKANLDYKIIASKLDKWTGRDIKEKLMKNMVHDAILANEKELTTNLALSIISKIQKGLRDPGTNPFSI